MKQKPITPYQRLVTEMREWVIKVLHPHAPAMFTFQNAKDGSVSFRLADLYQRVAAAEQLGYDCTVEIADCSLVFKYRKKIPIVPWQVAP